MNRRQQDEYQPQRLLEDHNSTHSATQSSSRLLRDKGFDSRRIHYSGSHGAKDARFRSLKKWHSTNALSQNDDRGFGTLQKGTAMSLSTSAIGVFPIIEDEELGSTRWESDPSHVKSCQGEQAKIDPTKVSQRPHKRASIPKPPRRQRSVEFIGEAQIPTPSS